MSEVELLLYSPIGPDGGKDKTVSAKAVAEFLAANKSAKVITVRIACPGGSVFDALAIYSSLKNHGAKIKARIDGLCASAAVIVLCAASEVEMSKDALIMVHKSSGVATGTAAEIRKTAELGDSLDRSMVRIISSKTGLAAAEVDAMLTKETWLTADEAQAMGFVTRITASAAMAALFPDDFLAEAPEHIRPVLAALQTPQAVTAANWLASGLPGQTDDFFYSELTEADRQLNAAIG